MGAGNVELTEYHATVAAKKLRSGSLVSRHTNGLLAEELEALSERGCRATAGSYRKDEKTVCEVDWSTLLTSFTEPCGLHACIYQFPPKVLYIGHVVLTLDSGNFAA